MFDESLRHFNSSSKFDRPTSERRTKIIQKNISVIRLIAEQVVSQKLPYAVHSIIKRLATIRAKNIEFFLWIITFVFLNTSTEFR